MRIELKVTRDEDSKEMHMTIEDCKITISQGLVEIEPYKEWKRVKSNGEVEIHIWGKRPC